MRLGLVGYGSGGRCFHAPYIKAADGVELAGVVARSEQTRAAVRADLPGVPIHASLGDMLRADVDAVTITTPPQTREALVLEALAAGVHVVADKPFAPTAAAGRALVQAAQAAGASLSVFHNRRFDADLRTLKAVLDGGRLGPLWQVHSRFDLDQPDQLDAGPEGGLLRDLGTHLVDQMMWLLGPVEAVSAQLDLVELPEGPTDAAFALALRHRCGTFSYVSSTKLNHLQERELRAYGASGSYTARSSDVQAEAIAAGRRPARDKAGWGYEMPQRWGTLRTGAGAEAVPSEQGAYFEFYEQFARAISGDGPLPSPGEEGVAVLDVLDAARRSARTGEWENVEGS